jgi:hypothetical protein
MCRLLCLKADARTDHVTNQLRRIWDQYRGAQGVVRELLTLALCVGIGVLVMPCLIFAVGRLVLGPYANGSLFALWRDFVAALSAGAVAPWFILLGPYLLVWVLRGGRQLLHNRARPKAVGD